ncbi:uncharacterized protein KY384_000424 [Bacidia gigantensis]|uniref:uncharacterized protein n=1 Tax=Bacidia gigantensis TaxID=2732470 RepID=UPI001D039346|nr:uncharacterized protein KY384_000424 [Bacidia gigantensis]KAG8525664.1 hypothetical protein KY384_000424 [Bacidia gigantensis]
MSQPRVLVVGASIAGPMAAYWLAKAGAHVTVIERFPKLRTNGQAIDIRTTGVTIMRKIPGMETAVRAKIVQIEGMSLLRDNGRPYGTIRATGNPDQQSLISEYEIHRGDLAKILVDLSREKGVQYVFGEQIASMKQVDNDGPVTVDFVNGFATAEYDLVVACDGATSRTRALGFGGGVRDYIAPVNSWAAFFSIKQDLINGSKVGHGYTAVGGRFLAVGNDPEGGNQITLMGMHPRNKRDLTLPFRNAMAEGEDALKRFIAQHYKGAGWKTDEVMEAMLGPGLKGFYASEIVQVKVPSLHKGRFALVGDAGYAPGPTGTGTTLAMTGAYVLAGEINKHQGDLATGLKGYEERMRPIIDDMQKIPIVIPHVVAPQTAWGLWLRNTIFAFIAWTNVLEYAQRFLGSAFADSDKYDLPHYEWVA